ncbi:hypothetical protein BH11MYX1_BH11MYX1_22920 [soil metagenome]
MNPICNVVAERVALGEPLGDVAHHATTCARCQRAVALPSSLVQTGHAADPGMGFASRVTAGAQHRITVRRRQRVAAIGLVSAAAVAAIVLLLVRPTGEPEAIVYVPEALLRQLPSTNPNPATPDPWMPKVPPAVDHDVRALVRLANTDRSMHLGARWDRLEKSLAPYGAVLKGTEP